jgi:hypothetical protein
MIIFAAFIQNAPKNDQQEKRRRLLCLKSEIVYMKLERDGGQPGV